MGKVSRIDDGRPRGRRNGSSDVHAQSDGSSGFAFPVEQWAFLSLVDRDCERRVRIITRGYGEDFATELTELIDSYRKLAGAGQLRPLWDAARKAYLAGDDAALAKLGLNRG